MNAITLEPCTPSALVTQAQTDLDQYLFASAREQAARELLQNSTRNKQRLFQRYLRSIEALKRHPGVPSSTVDALRIQLQNVRTGALP